MNLDTEKLKDIFKDYLYIVSAYLFGSYAKDRIGPMSDIDMAVLLKDNAPKGSGLIHKQDYLAYRFEMSVISNFCDFEPTIRFIKKFHLRGIKNRVARIWDRKIFRQR